MSTFETVCPVCAGTGTLILDAEFIARFWSLIDKSGGPLVCWPWLRGTTGDGYGTISYRGLKWGSHRLAYVLSNGAIPEGLDVLHSCDNPSCCNPIHLTADTNTENNRQRIERGRHNAPRGSRQWRTHLTENDILDIRRKKADGAGTHALAREYGVGVQAMIAIVHRRSWRHVT